MKKIVLRYENLIVFFNESLEREISHKNCLEIIRTQRQESLTFGQLRTRAGEFAIYLIQKKNIQIKDKIAILGKNQADWSVAFWGVILAGAIPVLIDPGGRTKRIKKHLCHTDVKLLIMANDYQDKRSRQEIKEFTSNQGVDLVEMTVYEKTGFDIKVLNKIPSEIKPNDTAVILCTSGTTKDPREVELTHANLIANLQGCLEAVEIGPEDKLGHIIPFHHSFGLTVAKLLPLWVGATSIYTDKYGQILQLIKERKITVFLGVPALFILFAKRIEKEIAGKKEKNLLLRILDSCSPRLIAEQLIKDQGLEYFRFFISGSAAVPRWVLEVFWKRGVKLYQGYGTTENSPVYGLNNNPQKLGSVGEPIPTLLVKIVDEKGQSLPSGEKGEIILGGPCIMKGYYRNPKATKAVIKTDERGTRWLYTGDLGYLDKDGYLFITGRKKYLIILSGGKNVNPELVEAALSQVKYVKEILVVPGYENGSFAAGEEFIKAIVQPDWNEIEADTGSPRDHWTNNLSSLKGILWKQINECQQKNQELAAFEKLKSADSLEIITEEFEKTTAGKIKRNAYF